VYAVTAVLALELAAAPPERAEERVRWAEPLSHSLTLMTVMRVTEGYLWHEPFASTNLSNIGEHYREAYTKPPLFDTSERAFEWDHDRWTINVFGHGLFGSELYVRARQCHFSVLGALAFTAGASATWEYGFEASGVRPSALDLVYTPLAGLLLGEARFFIHRAAGSIASPIGRTIVRVIVDPFGEIERAVFTKC